MDVSQCINMLGPGLDAPVQAVGRPTEVRTGGCDCTVYCRCSYDMTSHAGKEIVCMFWLQLACLSFCVCLRGPWDMAISSLTWLAQACSWAA